MSVPCPPLFSLRMAKLWRVNMDLEEDTIHLKKFDVKIKFEDVPYINVFEDIAKVKLESVPRRFHKVARDAAKDLH